MVKFRLKNGKEFEARIMGYTKIGGIQYIGAQLLYPKQGRHRQRWSAPIFAPAQSPRWRVI